jgi:hypothetical protein
MPTAIGPFDVEGSREDRRQVRRALKRCTYDLAAGLPYRITVEYRPPEKMPALPPPEKGKSKGYAYGRTIVVAKGLGDHLATYVILHEAAHHLRLSAAKMRDLMLLMTPKVQGLPTGGKLTDDERVAIRRAWRGNLYLLRPRECWPDSFPEAYSKPRMRSPYQGWYQRAIPDRDYPKARAIVERVPPEPEPDEVDPDEPEPLPPPLPPADAAAQAMEDAHELIDAQAATIAWQADQIGLAVRALTAPQPIPADEPEVEGDASA